MAGKSKLKGSAHNNNDARSSQTTTPRTPKTAKGGLEGPLKGHLGVKSGPFSPTDSKLISQYMVLDHMTAHYKNLNKTKACVDTTPPKAWLVSQKVRDRVRRESLKKELKRRDSWLATQRHAGNTSIASSEADRDEMFAMMQGLTAADGFDDVDFAFNKREESNTTLEVHVSEPDVQINEKDMHLVDRIVNDNSQSPSQYHSKKKIPSNIPREDSLAKKPGTPRSGDLIEKQKHKYTEEKPFTPRTLKSNGTSKLQEFKYYNPPKKRGPKSSHGVPSRSLSASKRPETPMTADSNDLMNETLMSRDLNHMRSPSGVPPLDISLDADHMHWLQEQSKRGKLRSSVKSEAASELSTYRLPADARKDLLESELKQETPGTFTLTGGLDSPHTKSLAMMKIHTQEEELKYLEFITDVTNDVLDRGIFTNRVLKSVFEAHVEKRKHELKVSKMRDMLDDLRRDLGIPVKDSLDSDNIGISSAHTWNQDDLASATKTLSVPEQNGNEKPMPSARSRRTANLGNTDLIATQKSGLPTLRLVKRGGEGKPPLPHARPVSRGSRSRPSSSCSRNDLQEVKEVNEELDITLVEPEETGAADILQINHHDDDSNARTTALLDDDNQGEITIEAQNAFDGENTIAPELGESQQHESEDNVFGDHRENELGETRHCEFQDTLEGDMTDTLHDQLLDYTNNIDDHSEIGSIGDAQEQLSDKQTDEFQTTARTEENGLAGTSYASDFSENEGTTKYDDDYDEDEENTLDEPQPVSVSSQPPKPTPRKRSITTLTQYNEVRDTPRSIEQTITSESIDISELEEDEITY